MTLTERWKKGELENDWYYIRTTNGIEKWEYIKQSHGFGYYETEWVVEVLSPVPSYEEWQELKEFADYSLHNRDELTRQINFWMDKHTQVEKENTQLRKFLEEFNALEVSKQNQRLKDLLKECREWIEYLEEIMLEKENIDGADYFERLLTKIDNVIGEKK